MKVFSNLAISLDGKIADLRDPKKTLGTPLDKKTMIVLRRKADVIVFGAQTLRTYPVALRLPVKKGAKRARNPVNAVITASGVIDSKLPFWDAEDVVRFVFTTKHGFERAQESARDRAFVVVAGDEGVNPRQVLERFKQSNLTNVLVEGGGEIMALFLDANLLQELNVTLTPWILGGRENPTLVGGEGLLSWTKLELLNSKKAGQELYLRYRVRGAKMV